MPLNLQYVSYDSKNYGAMICRQIRKGQSKINNPIGGRNLAVLCFTGTWFVGEAVIIASSFPNEQKHSEVKTFEGLSQQLDSKNKLALIQWLYTERAPCGAGPGMANCNNYLEIVFNSYYENFKMLGTGAVRVKDGIKTPVFYSYQYPSGGKEEVKEQLDFLNSVGIADEPDCITLKEYILELGKKDRAYVTATLKKFDKKK